MVEESYINKCHVVWYSSKNETSFIIGSSDYGVFFLQPLLLWWWKYVFPKPITVREAIGGLSRIKYNGGLEIEREFRSSCPNNLSMQSKTVFNVFNCMMKKKEK